jgi:hypothetical protein
MPNFKFVIVVTLLRFVILHILIMLFVYIISKREISAASTNMLIY